MAFELILLGALIFIFMVSFCGLLQKIKQTYERERILAERIARRREFERTHRNSSESFSEIYINPSFNTAGEGRTLEGSGIFPAAPPPYSLAYIEPPPKYEEVIKIHVIPPTPEALPENTQAAPIPSDARSSSSPPPYTITV